MIPLTLPSTKLLCLTALFSVLDILPAFMSVRQNQLHAQEQLTNSNGDADTAAAGDSVPPGYRTRKKMQKLADHFDQLVRQNPNDPLALAGLAESSPLLWCYGFVPRHEVFPAAKSAAIRAVEQDDGFGPAHTALGAIRLMDWNWSEAEREFKRGIELSPEDPKCRHWYGMYLAAMGRHREAMEQSRRAVELDSSGRFRIGRGAILYFVGEWAEMVDYMQTTVELDPTSDAAHDWLGMALVQEKQFDESIRIYRKAVELSGGSAEITAGLGHAYGVAGRRREAAQVLEKLDALSESWYVPPVQIAYVCAGLGQNDRAFELLEKAFQEKSWELVFVRTEPWFDHLHSDPRFVNLLRRMKFTNPKAN